MVSGVSGMCAELVKFFQWLKIHVISKYNKEVPPEVLRNLINQIQRILERQHQNLTHFFEEVLPEIQILIRNTLGVANLCLFMVIGYYALKIGYRLGSVVQASLELPIGMMPDLKDAAFALGAAVVSWLPGMGAWGASAGAAIVTLPVVGTVATGPAAVVGMTYFGWHFGRRCLRYRQALLDAGAAAQPCN